MRLKFFRIQTYNKNGLVGIVWCKFFVEIFIVLLFYCFIDVLALSHILVQKNPKTPKNLFFAL